MKKLFSTVFAIALMLSSAQIFAASLSVGGSMGLNPNTASLGSTIYQEVATKASSFSQENLAKAGAMSSLDISADVQLDWKYLFFRSGFSYEFSLKGGYTDSKIAATDTTVKYSYINASVPLILGLNYGLGSNCHAYAGAGVRFNFGNKLQAKKTEITTTMITGTTTTTTTNTYSNNGVGFTFLIGGDVKVFGKLNVFIEYQYDASCKVVKGETEIETASNITRVDSYSPVDNGGNTFRLGVKYKLLNF